MVHDMKTILLTPQPSAEMLSCEADNEERYVQHPSIPKGSFLTGKNSCVGTIPYEMCYMNYMLYDGDVVLILLIIIPTIVGYCHIQFNYDDQPMVH